MVFLRCLFGHDYSKNDCKCKRCGKAGHVWERCQCKQCRIVGPHRWVGCQCEDCGQTRDESHDWDGCRCRTCKRTRDVEHIWDGCQCRVCERIRNESHDWDGCRCKKCKSSRDVEHVWNGCRCMVCGRTRDESHAWDGCVCKACSKSRDLEHALRPMICGGNCKTEIGGKCKRCGQEQPDPSRAVRTESTNERGESEGQAPSVGYCCHQCANRALNENRSARSKTSCSDSGTGPDGFRVISFYSFYE